MAKKKKSNVVEVAEGIVLRRFSWSYDFDGVARANAELDYGKSQLDLVLNEETALTDPLGAVDEALEALHKALSDSTEG